MEKYLFLLACYNLALATRFICNNLTHAIIDGVCVDNDLNDISQSSIKIFSKKTNMTMVIFINQPYYFSIGLGKTMTNSDMWVFQVTKDFGQYAPPLDTALGGKNDVQLLGYYYNGTADEANPYKAKVKFTRALNTNDKYDHIIEQKNQWIVLAFGKKNQYYMDDHGRNYGSLFVPFIDQASGVFNIDENKITLHIWINIICWGILVDIPIIVARYFKTKSWYINVHWLFLIVLMVGSLATEITMIEASLNNFAPKAFISMQIKGQLHLLFGVIITLLIVIQCAFGLVELFIIYWKKYLQSISGYIIKIKKIHQIIGISLYLISKLNILTGAFIQWDGYLNKYDMFLYILYAFTLLWRLYLEVLFIKQENFVAYFLGYDKAPEVNQDVIENILLDDKRLISYIEMQDSENIKAEYPNKRWVIFNNRVIDITNQFHPGGMFIWEEYQGREISRYIYGAFGMEGTSIQPYTHSFYTMKMLEQLTIGTLRMVPIFSEDIQNFQLFTLASINKLTETVSLFYFCRENVTYLTNLEGIDNFGRYFLLKSQDPKISIRPYTMVLCCAAPNKKFRQALIAHCLRELEIEDIRDENRLEYVKYMSYYNELPLMIKRYASSTGFSQYIHSAPVSSQVYLSGPFGTGFGIDHEESGTILLAAAGTGLFPFLDLLDFLLKKTLNELMFQKSGKSDPLLNPGMINFSKYFVEGYKFILLLSVKQKDDLIGSDIYLTLLKLQQCLKKPNFEIILNISDGSFVQGVPTLQKARFDRNFFQNHLPSMRNLSRIFVCGSPSFNKNVPETLISMGISKQKIHIL